MGDDTGTTLPKTHEVPAAVRHAAVWPGDPPVAYTAHSEWLVLYKKERPVAEIFATSYLADDGGEDRPVTFVFNGGPGAASAYLHMGAIGPRRIAFPPDGTLPSPPARLVDNPESWLGFSDLVFIDPVGTGFSRAIEPTAKDKEGDKEAHDPKSFFGLKRDLESLGEFISRWLSTRSRWESPIFIAGESYGGFRAAKLARLLPESYGVGLTGAVLISPALEFAPLNPSDYDALPWIDKLPTMAAAAFFHGRSRAFEPGTPLTEVLDAAERFATTGYVAYLTRGAGLAAEERAAIVGRLADLIGLPFDVVQRAEGRITMQVFVRELLRDERKVLGLYDASVTAHDPFPDRPDFAGPDPTLAGIESAYTAAINQQLRQAIGVETERDYHLLSYDVFNSWKLDADQHALDSNVGATDDLRYGMSLNPELRVFITHGRYDLVTPYFTTDRIRNLMRLDPDVAARLTVEHYQGGHMFYAWEESRVAFRRRVGEFIQNALGA
ncbi:MAG: peptidase S10 [Acidimicrobiia bacterium]|nr:peptidase S10 [Acidimicrobiia bacterium]MBT8217998.1 peptidase S10 [Acidimicrobiia bacterium]NNF09137.1 peptidase S10 [Acidimicrobiia bacterium]NNL70484.1 peptidase S10 [Acidimicrobiia bacterium]